MDDTVTITRLEYEALIEAREDLEDIKAFDAAKAIGGESFPADVVTKILDGESPLLVYRNYRGMTQQGLSEASGVNRVQIANIESGKKTGSVETLKKLADALNIAIDDLV